MCCDRLEYPVFHKKRAKLTEKPEKINMFLHNCNIYFSFWSFSSSCDPPVLKCTRSFRFPQIRWDENIDPPSNSTQLLLSESMRQHSEIWEHHSAGNRADWLYNIWFFIWRIYLLLQEGGNPKMFWYRETFINVKPPRRLNNTEPVYSELDGTLWCSAANIVGESGLLNPYKIML